ncbi:MAG: sigma-70 family RNA polymerase sigma factor [Bacteroidales bacterium]
MADNSDSKILELFRDPESSHYGFNLLVRKYQKPIYWLIRRMVIDHNDADDLVQETFIKVWKNLKNFRSDAQLYTWIYRIATNETLGFLRTKKRVLFIPLVDYESKLAGKLEDDNFFNGDEIQLKLQKAILKLPEKQRLVFNMKYFDELKYDEMSKILSTSVGALKASYHIAVKKIENSIKEY